MLCTSFALVTSKDHNFTASNLPVSSKVSDEMEHRQGMSGFRLSMEFKETNEVIYKHG